MKFALTTVLLITAISCSTEPETTPPIGNAEIVLIAEFTDAQTGEPVASQNFLVTTTFEDYDDEPVSHGSHQTDERGILQTNLRNFTEAKATGITFTYGPENNRKTVTQEKEFVLKIEEPYDTLDLNFEI